MIQIYAKNSLYRDALMAALAEFNPQIFQETTTNAEILLICEEVADLEKIIKNQSSSSIVLLGAQHPDSDLELKLPCLLSDLKMHLSHILEKRKTAPNFENKYFIFEGSKRLLTCKPTKLQIYLTEKETELITYLIKALPESVSKSELLTEVWNYRPDSETHTVESHIYTLRQKLGEKYSDSLITNTTDGYILSQK